MEAFCRKNVEMPLKCVKPEFKTAVTTHYAASE